MITKIGIVITMPDMRSPAASWDADLSRRLDTPRWYGIASYQE